MLSRSRQLQQNHSQLAELTMETDSQQQGLVKQKKWFLIGQSSEGWLQMAKGSSETNQYGSPDVIYFWCFSDEWYREQAPIGGPGVVVEIDETLITRRKYNRGRLPTQIWLFGGIERVSKRKFIVPLTGDVAENRTKETLLPLITKYIVKGSVIYSDAFRSYHTLKDLGYTHSVVNHSKNFVDPEDPKVHTQNIERLWKDGKISWVKRPVNHNQHFVDPQTGAFGKTFCSEVTDEWYRQQAPIGGPGVVEIDETLITRRKYNRGRLPTQIWLFGGIERVSKRKFIVPLTGDVAENRTKETLLPLITKYIVKGSVIYSDAFRSYHTLKDLGYTHSVVNHSKNFVDPEDPNVHTQNIERLWKDVKSWVKRPGDLG
ncbi:hypothetical protein EGW08_020775 [Elysia chlorotica]|uniref:ISXO2-like transposase domain-containing protein n=1 Tax=Elysia chlorotica TaxID=188477 RepID=A0A3S1H3F8_ELYCH|nr:hypothetical protein EGW08_020775 [Elysia chlorotica]